MVGLCNNMPCWLETLLGERFFQPCSTHESARKNERNIFCLDCCSCFCPQCLPPHRSHRLLQIRRYVYQDVIRVDDLEKLIDCAFVQSYTTNSAKVVFINERPQTRPFRISGHICISCDRPLQDPYLFCSLSCKVKHLVGNEGGLTRHLHDCKFLPLPSPCNTDDGQVTPDTVLESPNISSGSSSGGGVGVEAPGMLCYSRSEVVVRKKRSNLVASPPAGVAAVPTRHSRCSETNRRKGAPSRSPLY